MTDEKAAEVKIMIRMIMIMIMIRMIDYDYDGFHCSDDFVRLQFNLLKKFKFKDFVPFKVREKNKWKARERRAAISREEKRIKEGKVQRFFSGPKRHLADQGLDGNG